jgi:transposase
MYWTLERLLNLPEVTIVKVQEVEDLICLELQGRREGIVCHHCGEYTDEVNQTRFVLVRDLPISGRGVYLQVQRRQFYCHKCGKYTTEPLDYIVFKRHHTKRYEEYIYQRVAVTTVKQVCREEELKADEIQAIFDAVSREKTQKNWLEVKRIGLDEMSTRKGKRKYKAMVSDLEKKRLIEVVDGRSQEEVITALMEEPKEIREKVSEVCIDMWGGFPKVIETVFPQAIIVYDRFHVMQRVNKRLNEIRRKLGIKTRGSRHLLLSNREDLTEAETEELSLLFKDSPSLGIAQEIREELRQIYEHSRTPSGAGRKLKKWLHTAQVFYGQVCDTIRKYFEGICHYFINRTTNGAMEGLNNRSRVILRQTYGLNNFEHLRARLLAANH